MIQKHLGEKANLRIGAMKVKGLIVIFHWVTGRKILPFRLILKLRCALGAASNHTWFPQITHFLLLTV